MSTTNDDNKCSKSALDILSLDTTASALIQKFFIYYVNNQYNEMASLFIHEDHIITNFDEFLQLRLKYIGEIDNDDDTINIPLLLAASLTNNPTTIDFIIQKCQINDVNTNRNENQDGLLLSIITQNGHLQSIQHLIEKYDINTDVKILNQSKALHQTLLNYAALSRNIDVIKYLTPLCFHTTSIESISEAVHELARCGLLDGIKYYIEEYNVDINIKSFYSLTLLDSASKSNNIELIQYLIDLGLSITGAMPITTAISSFQWDVAKYIITRYNIDIGLISTVNTPALVFIAQQSNSTPELFDSFVDIGVNDIEQEDHLGNTPLLTAIANGNSILAKHLITKYNANISKINRDGQNILFGLVSSKECTVEMINFCMNFNLLDINHIDNDKYTPLSQAIALQPSVDIIQSLLLHKAKINNKIIKKSISSIVDTNVLELLLSESKKSLTTDEPFEISVVQLESLLFTSVMNGNLSMVQYLIEQCKINPLIKNSNGATLLTTATRGQSLELVSYLLSFDELKKQINTTTNNGFTPLTSAILDRKIPTPLPINADIIQLLLNNGADINTLAINTKLTPFTFRAFTYNHLICPIHINFMGFNTDEMIYYGQSLQLQREHQHTILFRILLHYFKSNINVHDRMSLSMLHHLAKSPYLDLIKFIFKYSFYKINIDMMTTNKTTPLHTAISSKQFSVAAYLIEQNADINTTNQNNSSLYHSALQHNQDVTTFDMLELLFQHHANINIRTNEGFTPLLLSCKHLNWSHIQWFIQHGANIHITNLKQCSLLHEISLSSNGGNKPAGNNNNNNNNNQNNNNDGARQLLRAFNVALRRTLDTHIPRKQDDWNDDDQNQFESIIQQLITKL